MIFLPNHDVHARALAYDPATGAAEGISREQMPREDLGFYVDCGVGVLGIYASSDGPVLFRDAQRIPLEDGVRLEITRGRRRNTFTVSRGDDELLTISYAPPGDVGTHAYADEDMVDFYAWLAASFPSERFNRFYTRAA